MERGHRAVPSTLVLNDHHRREVPRTTANLAAVSKVLIVGLPRSGTSWVGKALGLAPGTAYVHEPDGDHDPFAYRARRGSFITPVLRPGDDAPELERLWQGAFAGGQRPTAFRSRLAWRLYRKSPVEQRWEAWSTGRETLSLKVISALAVPLEPVPTAQHVVAKSVRAEFCVEWICDRFAPAVVIVERHPLNALSSWSELGYGKDPRTLGPFGEIARERWGVRAPAVDAPLIERQAFVYGVGAAALREAVRANPSWVVVSHEALCVDPQTSIRALLDRVGLGWGVATQRYLDESDRDGSGYLTQRKAREQPDRWQSRLDSEQVDTITSTLAEFPFDLMT